MLYTLKVDSPGLCLKSPQSADETGCNDTDWSTLSPVSEDSNLSPGGLVPRRAAIMIVAKALKSHSLWLPPSHGCLTLQTPRMPLCCDPATTLVSLWPCGGSSGEVLQDRVGIKSKTYLFLCNSLDSLDHPSLPHYPRIWWAGGRKGQLALIPRALPLSWVYPSS